MDTNTFLFSLFFTFQNKSTVSCDAWQIPLDAGRSGLVGYVSHGPTVGTGLSFVSSAMNTRTHLFLAASAALSIASAVHATPVATARSYSLNGNQPYFDDASVSALVPAADNLLYGLAPVAVEGAIRSGMGNNGTYWETQASSPACLTDGAIPTHEDTSNWNKESNARWLVSDNSTLTWTFAEPKQLADVRLWTQWPDGNRNDIAVSSIQVTTDGSTWTTLPNSSFCSGKSNGNAVVMNSITPALDNSTHFRMVKYADDAGALLASDITGLRIVFPEQELGYTCFWEIEAGSSASDPSFEVKNTVNGGTDYTGIGEVAVKVMPTMPGYDEYQFTVGDAQPAADGWKAYAPGTVPADVISFALPQELDAEITVHCRLRGSGVADLDLTDTIKSAYGAQPTASVSGALSVLMANTYDGALVTAAQILALNTSSDTHGGLVSVSAEDAVVRGDTNLVLTVTNLAGNSASCNVPVTTTLAGGALPQAYLSTLLHLGAIFQTDDLLGNGGATHDYLSAFGGERNVLPHAGVAYTGLNTSTHASTPGTLVWTVLSAANGHWEPTDRDNYVKYWHVYIVSPDDRDVSWRCKNDDDIFVWVNGEQQAYYGYNGGGATSQGHLKAGVNSVTIKLYENGGGDFMEVALRKPDGTTYFDDLEYRLDPGFLMADATTGSREALSSGQVRIVSIPRIGGYTRYQVFQDDADGTAQPGDTWTAYDPDNLPATSIAYTAPANLGDNVYFTIVLSDDDGTNVKRETIHIATLNTYGSLTVHPSDESAAVSGTANLSGVSGTAVVSYGTDPASLTRTASFAINAAGEFSGTLSNLASDTTYYWQVEILETGSRTGFGTGDFTTIGFERFGNCDVVNASTASDGNYAVVTFTSNGRIRFEEPVTLDVLVVGGGGGGGNGGYAGGGGGGAGGVVYQQQVALAAGTYDVTVGTGGAENEKGTDSVFATYRAYGGGAGNHGFGDPNTTDDGASGGGASAVSDWVREAGTGMDGQGHDGGLNLHSAVLADDSLETKTVKNYSGQPINGGGGGGGAGAPGGIGSFIVKEYKDDNGTWTAFCDYYYAGNGGDGIACSITGEELWYGGGGGGGLGGWYRNGSESSGGKGGGGKGGTYQDWAYDGDPTHGYKRNGEDAVNGTGGGGGGGGSNGNENSASNGGRGGDGIVIIRFAQTFAEDSYAGSGGTITKKNGYMIHTFTESGTFDLPNSTYADILLVGGGGGGGNGYGAAGGGGAGGMIVIEHTTFLAGKHTVTIGAGGLGGIRNRENGGNGGDTVFYGHTAIGGGGGAGIWDVHGLAGGSGGGAYSMTLMNNRGPYNGGTGVEGQGHNGGGSVLNNDNSDNFGAGGGGAGEAGYSSTVSAPGKGGDGLMCDITGEEVWYAGGGAGGGNGNVGWNVAAEGGKGGGGASGHWPNGVTTDYNSDNEAFIGPGTPGTGGGGGGGASWGTGNHQGPGGHGGSGVVIVRYKLRPETTVIVFR